jgi:hypothetical protein
MTRPGLIERLSTPSTISRYAMAALSIAVAIVAAELIARLLNAEAIAFSMLCAVILATLSSHLVSLRTELVAPAQQEAS